MEVDKRILYLLAFIFSLVGGIVALTTDFTCMYAYYTICMFVDSEYMEAYNGLVIVMGIILLVGGAFSFILILKPELEDINIIRINFTISLVVGVVVPRFNFIIAVINTIS